MKIVFDFSDQRNVLACDYFTAKNKKTAKLGTFSIEKGDFCVFSPAKKWTPEEILSLCDDITVLAGGIDDECRAIFASKHIKYINILEDEAFAIRNANYTAEGVLAIMLAETNKSIFEQNVLIVGAGRIGKALAVLFGRLGLNFTLGSFSEKDKIQGNFYLCRCKPKGSFLKELDKYDVIINTIPNVVFDAENVQQIHRDAILIETASKYCIAETSNLPFKFIVAGKLPQKYCLESASNLVIAKIEEVLDD